MHKGLLAFAVSALMASCANQYNVQGSSSISSLDGSKLYLKAVKNNELKSIDSCDIVHGQFHFSGVLDTVRMANLFMDEESIMPVVLSDLFALLYMMPHHIHCLLNILLEDFLFRILTCLL